MAVENEDDDEDDWGGRAKHINRRIGVRDLAPELGPRARQKSSPSRDRTTTLGCNEEGGAAEY